MDLIFFHKNKNNNGTIDRILRLYIGNLRYFYPSFFSCKGLNLSVILKDFLFIIFSLLLFTYQVNAEKLTIGTYNIAHSRLTPTNSLDSWDNRKEEVLNVIQNASLVPDLLVLQEDLRDQIDFLEEELTGYQLIGHAASDNNLEEGLSFWLKRGSQFEVIGWGYERFPDDISTAFYLTHGFTWASFRSVANGSVIKIYNVHLESGSSESRIRDRRAQAQRVSDFVWSSDLGAEKIIIGDFNADILSGNSQTTLKFFTLDQEDPDFPDDMEHHENSKTLLCIIDGCSIPTFIQGNRIDHILRTETIKHLNFKVLGKETYSQNYYPSDHYLLIQKIDFGEEQQYFPVVINNQKNCIENQRNCTDKKKIVLIPL